MKDAESRPAEPRVASPLSISQLAHELNSLLDGAARCVRQVQEDLAHPDKIARGTAHEHGASRERMAQRLNLASSAMHKMAALLERAMQREQPDQRVLATDRTLGEFVPDLIASLRPKAREGHVAFSLHMTNDAASVPTGSLGTVLMNGLTNAIDACASSTNSPRMTEVSISINNRSELVILISDTGPGLIERADDNHQGARTTKPHGHGIGLELSRQIVEDLGGRLQLTNIPFGAGAIFQVRVPLPRLRAA